MEKDKEIKLKTTEQIAQYWADQYAPDHWGRNPVAHYSSNVKGRADWLPDAGIIEFVQDVISAALPDDADLILKTNMYWTTKPK